MRFLSRTAQTEGRMTELIIYIEIGWNQQNLYRRTATHEGGTGP